MLDNVINLNFPAKPKLYVHRVGRVARAGREGLAFSLISQDEMPFLLDLYVFLGKALAITSSKGETQDKDGLLGDVPQSLIDEMEEQLQLWHREQTDLQNMKKVVDNALKKYIRSRPQAAQESIKRYKEMLQNEHRIGTHPVFASQIGNDEEQRNLLLNALKTYKGNTTIFETNTKAKNKCFDVMKGKREYHQAVIQRRQDRVTDNSFPTTEDTQSSNQQEADENDLQDTFSVVIGEKRKNKFYDPYKKKKRKLENVRDEENYLHYRPADFNSEQGLSLGTTFDKEASGAMLDLCDEQQKFQTKSNKKWDRKKKKFVSTNEQEARKKKIRTESGALISASYKSHAYKDWLNKNKMREEEGSEDDDDDKKDDRNENSHRFRITGTKNRKWHTKGSSKDAVDDQKKGSKKRELKKADEIFKQRKLKAKKEAFQKHRKNKKQARRNFKMQKSKKRK